MQMKMFLTRLGENAPHDRHRRSDARSTCRPTPSPGLVEALRILDGVPGIVTVRFNETDVVRHPLVAEIVRAYDRDGKLARGAERRELTDDGWPMPARRELGIADAAGRRST